MQVLDIFPLNTGSRNHIHITKEFYTSIDLAANLLLHFGYTLSGHMRVNNTANSLVVRVFTLPFIDADYDCN